MATNSEEAILCMIFQEVRDHLSKRMKILSGKDRLAVQQEFLEWITLEFDELEISFMDYHSF